MSGAQSNAAVRLARLAVQSMVADRVRVVVDTGPARATDGGGHPVWPRNVPISVELTGRGSNLPFPDAWMAATGEACAWSDDEIVSAARRATERALKCNPSWRRGPVAEAPAVPAAIPIDVP